MKKIVIDTNCLISFVTDRNPAQQEKIAALFSQASKLKKLVVCHLHVISEFIYVLTNVYSLNTRNVKQMVADLVAMPGVFYTSEVDIATVLSLWPEKIPDYSDAILAAYCKTTKGTYIATFDKRFNHALKAFGLPIFEFDD